MENNRKTVYTAEVTATGGRNGQVTSSDGALTLKVSVPEGMNSKNGNTNPEQLFAAGYASCFQSALMVVARKHQMEISSESTVTAQVDLDRFDNGSYGLGVRLHVDLKGIDREKGQQLVDEAHQICPYSVGIKDNVKVDLQLV